MLFAFLNKITDLVLAPFSGLSPSVSLITVSFVSAIILLYIFKLSSNQEKIKYHKNKIFGHFLEIAIYRDQFSRTMICQGNILKHNLHYLRYFLFPLLIIMPPVLLVCMQLDFRLGSEPLQKNQSFIIQAKIDNEVSTNTEETINTISITTTDNIVLETKALHSVAESSIFWRASNIDTTGKHSIKIQVNNTDDVIEKPIAVGDGKGRFSPDTRKIKSFSDNLFSGEDNIHKDSQIQLVRVNYPPAAYTFLAWDLSPIIYYFVLTLIFSLLLKPLIKVNI